MTPEWKKYTGSAEQIAEMINATDGILFNIDDEIFDASDTTADNLKIYLADWNIKQYLICQPHPLADMICQQARTGQPVYVRDHLDTLIATNQYDEYVTNTPDWYIPTAEYSFTPFKEEK